MRLFIFALGIAAILAGVYNGVAPVSRLVAVLGGTTAVLIGMLLCIVTMCMENEEGRE